MIRSWTLAAIGLAVCSSIEAMAADPLPTETFKILPAALAVEAAEAAIASCKGQGYNIAVAIVDRAGDLRLLLVGEGASALARDLSRRKANGGLNCFRGEAVFHGSLISTCSRSMLCAPICATNALPIGRRELICADRSAGEIALGFAQVQSARSLT